MVKREQLKKNIMVEQLSAAVSLSFEVENMTLTQLCSINCETAESGQAGAGQAAL